MDDVAVPEAGFLDDAEADAGGWERAGFRRVSAPLEQRFELRLVTFGAAPGVREIEPDGSNRAAVDLAGLGTEYQRAVLVVMGATDGTIERTAYRYHVGPSTAP
jgi:hypothetical protein